MGSVTVSLGGGKNRLMLDKWLVSLVWCGVLHAVCLLALYGSWVETVTRLCLVYVHLIGYSWV